MSNKSKQDSRFRARPTVIHSKLTQTFRAEPMTAAEILAAATADKQDSHWDAIVGHIITMGQGE